MARGGRRHGTMTADTEGRRPPRRDRTRRAQGPNSPRAASRVRVDASGELTFRCGVSTRVPSPPRRRRVAPVDGAPRREASSARSSGVPATLGHAPHRSYLLRAGVPGGRGGRVHAAMRTPLRARLHTESSSSLQEAPTPRRRAYRNAGAAPSGLAHSPLVAADDCANDQLPLTVPIRSRIPGSPIPT